MTLSPRHENIRCLFDPLVRTAVEELGLALASYGSTTLKRRRQKRGLEPDQCYWIANEALVRGKTRFDFRVDPPPDLAIEVDITSSSVNRMAIYAVLGVREVWRFDGQALAFHVLGANARYGEVSHSQALPLLSAADVLRFVNLRGQLDEIELVRQFRTWLRQQIAATKPPTP
jgi:Uma2 family endonuclease